MAATRLKTAALFGALVLAVVVVYANHFDNPFELDDASTVVENRYIRDLRHIPTMFVDAKTFSIDPTNQTYRPLVTASLAVDYAIGRGLKPLWFHVSTFVWFVVLLALMYALFVHVMNRAREQPSNRYLAMFAVAWFALHPVSAETVNYICQRGDLYATLGSVAALVVYARFPALRRFGLYLIPALLGMLAQQSALMFAPLLFLYVLLFERDEEPAADSTLWSNAVVAGRRSIPAVAMACAYYVFQLVMTEDTWTSGGASRLDYWFTQPIVTLHYAISLFVPTSLNVDSARDLVTSLFAEEVIIGGAFLVALVVVIWRTARVRELRPVTFGLAWFLVTLVPTAVVAFAEPQDDHRMFFPFVGLILAVTWGGARWIERTLETRQVSARVRRLIPVIAVLVLAAYGVGAHRRNVVWDSDETLWKDVTEKSPRNPRGFMNYGVALMKRGNYHGALKSFITAKRFAPDYYLLEINLGIAHGALGFDQEAEQAFLQAMALAPNRTEPSFHYARWLATKHRVDESIALLERILALRPNDLTTAHLMMKVQIDAKRIPAAGLLATAMLERFPDDAQSKRNLATAKRWEAAMAAHGPEILQAENAVRTNSSPESLLDLSLHYTLAGLHRESIVAAREALVRRPDYPEAYNNISAAAAALEDWKAAIEAAEQALRLKPDFERARNNLVYAQQQLAASSAGKP